MSIRVWWSRQDSMHHLSIFITVVKGWKQTGFTTGEEEYGQ